MAQALFCPGCRVEFSLELRGKSCPACGEELIRGRIPSSRKVLKGHSTRSGRAVWDYIIRKDLCAYCGRLSPPNTIDHIMPKALGGSKGSWTNRTGACFTCNQSKAHTPMLHFMLELRGTDLSHLKDEDDHWPIPDGGEMEERITEDAPPLAHGKPDRLFMKKAA